jgi:hypothetical protein
MQFKQILGMSLRTASWFYLTQILDSTFDSVVFGQVFDPDRQIWHYILKNFSAVRELVFLKDNYTKHDQSRTKSGYRRISCQK